MSQKAVAEIIGKALADARFRRRLFADPHSVLAEYRLSQEEVDAIRLSLESGDTTTSARDLESRVSRARLPLDALSDLFARADHGLEGAPSGDGSPSDEGSRDLHDAPHDLSDESSSPEGAVGPQGALPGEAHGLSAGDRDASMLESIKAMVDGATRDRPRDMTVAGDSPDAALQSALAEALARARVTPAGRDAGATPSGAPGGLPIGPSGEPIQHETDLAAVGPDAFTSRTDAPMAGMPGGGDGPDPLGGGPVGGDAPPWPGGGVPTDRGTDYLPGESGIGPPHEGVPAGMDQSPWSGGGGRGTGTGWDGTSSSGSGPSGTGGPYGMGSGPDDFRPEHTSDGGQTPDDVAQALYDFCKKAWDSGDRGEGREGSSWFAEKAAQFFSQRLDMSDPENAKLVGVLETVSQWDTGTVPPKITVTRPPSDEGGAGQDDTSGGPTWGDLTGDADDLSDSGAGQQGGSGSSSGSGTAGSESEGPSWGDLTGDADDEGDDEGGDETEEDTEGDDEGSDEDEGSGEAGNSLDGGGDDTGGRQSIPIGAGSAGGGPGEVRGGERDDSGQSPVILEAGTGPTGGDEPGGTQDDSGHRAPILEGAAPARVVSPEMAPLYDPVESQARAAEVSSGASAVNAAAPENLRPASDQGGSIARQLGSEESDEGDEGVQAEHSDEDDEGIQA